jgi:hypothetical protein
VAYARLGRPVEARIEFSRLSSTMRTALEQQSLQMAQLLDQEIERLERPSS